MANKRDQYTVVLEDLRGDFKVFGETLSFVRDDVKTLKDDLSGFKEETRSNFKTVFNYLSKIDDELISIKT
ncbi:MAG: hypothetical protein HYT48_02795 [Candidatus Vogelbacteria bacterium]|nr:hypothetical protein [Candidatus Vogelbacteria bacterium]